MPRKNISIDFNRLEQFMSLMHKIDGRKIDLELIGGEPTMHPQFYGFCNRMISNDSINSIMVYTNFSQPIQAIAQLMSIGIKLFVSWHGGADDNEFYSKLIKLSGYKDNIIISIMYEKENIHRSLIMYDRLKDTFKYISMHLILYDLMDCKLHYTQDELFEFYKRIDKDFVNDIEYYDGTRSTCLDNAMYLDTETYTFKNWLCNAGKDFLYVHFDGFVYNCPDDFYSKCMPIGSIYDQSFKPSFKPVICKYLKCSCGQDILKRNIFKL